MPELATDHALDMPELAIEPADHIPELAAEPVHDVPELDAEPVHEVPDLTTDPGHNVPDLATDPGHNVPDLATDPVHDVPDLATDLVQDIPDLANDPVLEMWDLAADPPHDLPDPYIPVNQALDMSDTASTLEHELPGRDNQLPHLFGMTSDHELEGVDDFQDVGPTGMAEVISHTQQEGPVHELVEFIHSDLDVPLVLLSEDEDVFQKSEGEVYDADNDSNSDQETEVDLTLYGPPSEGNLGDSPHSSLHHTGVTEALAQATPVAEALREFSASSVTAESLSDDEEVTERPTFRRSKRVRKPREIMNYEKLGEPRIKRFPFLFKLEALPTNFTYP